MVKFFYLDGSYCFRPLQTVHAIFTNDNGVLIARLQKQDGSFYEVEILRFELLETGRAYN